MVPQKGRNIVPYITLTGSAIAAICCIIKKLTLLQMLLIVLASLVVFMILGFIVKRVFVKIDDSANERILQEEKEEKERLEMEALEREAMLEAAGKEDNNGEVKFDQ